MGSQDVMTGVAAADRAQFIRSVLEDLEALQALIDSGTMDEAPRIGAEQEFAILDVGSLPAPLGEPLLRSLAADPRFTAELGRCNIEGNLTPLAFRGRCLSTLREELTELTEKARAAARTLGAELVLAGIVPTFEPLHAGMDQLTARARYLEMNRTTLVGHGGRIPLCIQGIDQVNLWHDSIALEAATTSFQVHLQVPPRAFAQVFNCAMLAAAPLLAVSANSALFAARRLWHETRIPLLEASGDVRRLSQWRRAGRGRTSLGGCWVEDLIADLYRRDLARFDPMLIPRREGSSLEALRQGQVPRLHALNLFNGTIWRWVRACYGVTDGKPHLRIENRVLPAGPTIADQLANAALWLGLMVAMPVEYGDFRSRLPFSHADANFHAAAREGLDARMTWLDGERLTARELLLGKLLPLARGGLEAAGVDAADATAALDLIEERVRCDQTGAQWMLRSYDRAAAQSSPRLATWTVASALKDRCWSGQPVHRWELAELPRTTVPAEALTLALAVRTDFPAVSADAPLELAAVVLEEHGLTHVVVEEEDGTLVGMLEAAEVTRALRPGPRLLDAEAPLQAPTVRSLVRRVPTMEGITGPALALLAEMEAQGQPCRVVMQGDHAAGLVFLEDLRALLRWASGGTDAPPVAAGTGTMPS